MVIIKNKNIMVLFRKSKNIYETIFSSSPADDGMCEQLI